MKYSEKKAANILLVEDDIADIRLTQEAFKKCKINVNLHVVVNGEEAIEFLHKRGKFAESPRPDLILLDLNMPKKNGKETLKDIKQDPLLNSIPVIILTISQSEQDVLECYRLYASSYIIKPLDLNIFNEIISLIENYWLGVTTLPPHEAAP